MYFHSFIISSLIASAFANPIKKCGFPQDEDITNVGANGWAMSPDEPCTPGKFCPFACPPGKLMNQWDPEAVSYTFPKSMNGGLYCNEDGTTSKPFIGRSLCIDGVGTVSVVNKASDVVSFCQTVLPGNEAMLIPTEVGDGDEQVLAVPGPGIGQEQQPIIMSIYLVFPAKMLVYGALQKRLLGTGLHM